MVARAVVGASLIYGNRIACKMGNPIVLSYYTTKEINRFIWYNELRTMKASGYTSPMEYGRLKCWELNNWRGIMDKKEEIYFVHGFYYGNENDYLRRIDQDITFQDRVSGTERIKPDHIILIKDSIDDESAVQSLDVNIRNIEIDDGITQGTYVYYNEESIVSAENDPAVAVYKELNNVITQSLRYENENNEPDVDNYDNVSDICSYHVACRLLSKRNNVFQQKLRI